MADYAEPLFLLPALRSGETYSDGAVSVVFVAYRRAVLR